MHDQYIYRCDNECEHNHINFLWRRGDSNRQPDDQQLVMLSARAGANATFSLCDLVAVLIYRFARILQVLLGFSHAVTHGLG